MPYGSDMPAWNVIVVHELGLESAFPRMTWRDLEVRLQAAWSWECLLPIAYLRELSVSAFQCRSAQ